MKYLPTADKVKEKCLHHGFPLDYSYKRINSRQSIMESERLRVQSMDK
jgi:hypothetical protein